MNNIFIENSYFYDISREGSGGVFDLNSVLIHISCCLFIKTSSTSFGGCLFAINSHISLKNSLFNECRIPVNQNELLGNAIYINNAIYTTNEEQALTSCISTVDQISHTKCGKELTDADSSICFNNIQYKITNMNSSFNTGTIGSSLFSGYNSIPGSSVNYSQDSQSTAYVSIQSTYKKYDCFFCNFINTENLQKAIVWSEPLNNLLEFYSCIFYNSLETLYNSPCIFNDCQSDREFADISLRISSLELVHLNQGFNSKYCKKSAQTLQYHPNLILLLKPFVYLFIIYK